MSEYQYQEQVDTRPLSEQVEEIIIDLVGEYEIQTTETTEVTSDGAITIEVIPGGIASLDYMWFLAVAIYYFIIKAVVGIVVACFNRFFGTKRRKKF